MKKGENMRILILWRDLPDPTHPSLARPYYFIKYNRNHKISLLSYSHSSSSSMEFFKNNCERIELVERPYINSVSHLLVNIKNRASFDNILNTRDLNILKDYSPIMNHRLNKILDSEKYDVVYSDYMMMQYLYNKRLNIPVILEFFSPTLHVFCQQYLYESNSFKKIEHIFKYFFYKMFEVSRYSEFDAGIYVSNSHREYSKPLLTRKSYIVPPGVDLDISMPSSIFSSPNLVFVGSMNYFVNAHSIIDFIENIYPLIKAEIPNITLYIIGRDPPDNLRKLASMDKSIIVTGEVDDVVEFYKYEPQVVIVPIIIDDGGIKTKVIEAMGMGKAIVTTSIGFRNIGASNGKELLIADTPSEFANYTSLLLKDHKKRGELGRNARKFAEKNYSWTYVTGLLEKIIEDFK